MGLISRTLKSVSKLVRGGARGSEPGAAARSVRSVGDRVDANRIDPVFSERRWTEPPPGEAPEAGFRVDDSMTVDDAEFSNEFIEETVGAFRSIGDGNREITSVRANADSVVNPSEPSGADPIVNAEWVDRANDAGGRVEVRRDGTIQSYQNAIDVRGLDTDNPSMRTYGGADETDIFDGV